MLPLRIVVVTPTLPAPLTPLRELAYNYWWCWDSEAQSLFARLDPKLWDEVHHNPLALLQRISQARLSEAARDPDFLAVLQYIYQRFRTYLEAPIRFSAPSGTILGTVAYFCAEYGIHESFPNYAGGLGVLSGDFLKTASDIGIPLVALGLLYQQGYFQQRLAESGWQYELYPANDISLLPLTLVRDETGRPLLISLPFPKGPLYIRIWRMLVGRVPLYLLDTNHEYNSLVEYRDITDRLYGGTIETRIQQELVLGIGGMRALRAMGIRPAVCHLNEGHSVLAAAEWIRQTMEEHSVGFSEALEIVRASTVFVTHTPVPAGNEVFRADLLRHYLEPYAAEIGVRPEQLLQLGQLPSDPAAFSPTVFGLNVAWHRRGVSRLHGKTARHMWHALWPSFPEDEVPIGSINNGVHLPTWVAPEIAHLFDRYIGKRWRSENADPVLWDAVEAIPPQELWRVHETLRKRLISALQERYRTFPATPSLLLNPDALTIGFARRIALYKRPGLLFRDPKRLRRLLCSSERPVQLILAGKAHPQDIPAKETIHSIIRAIVDAGLERHVVFVENYSLELARLLVQGCDLWLNTPRRPQEASGTSGMKAALNGVLHCSTLDGWWDEAYTGMNGFAIGQGEEYTSEEEQDAAEAEQLYDLLEYRIIPLFYERNPEGIPERWVTMMKNAIRTAAAQYSCTRMVRQYAAECYLPAHRARSMLLDSQASLVHSITHWRQRVQEQWPNVRILRVISSADTELSTGALLHVRVEAELGGLSPEDVRVELYAGRVQPEGEMTEPWVIPLEHVSSNGSIHWFAGHLSLEESGQFGYTVRIVPWHPALPSSAELRLCCWAQPWTHVIEDAAPSSLAAGGSSDSQSRKERADT
ncbi:MAG: alpha-glucan family phosphorylase [Candidatus Kapabacteria bacterium]|nr:alpha-glucan family phosphorylase [Candidatus Kapabacteria bacterium]MDW8011893.1 alpha-glucan family phosphorylase [Bacteroidota bacterium]